MSRLITESIDEALRELPAEKNIPAWLERDIRLPFSELTGDEFEILCFLLLRAKFPNDRIYYYGKTSDMGRDIIHVSQNGHIRLIQCKNYSSNVSPSATAAEMAKVYVNVHSGKIPEKPDEVVFFVSRDLSTQAKDLITVQDKWLGVADAILKKFLKAEPSDELKQFAHEWWPFGDWKPGLVISEDVKKCHKGLIDTFFTVRKVIDGRREDVRRDFREELNSAFPWLSLRPEVSETDDMGTSLRDTRMDVDRYQFSTDVTAYVRRARDVLSRWQLFTSMREIRIEDVYVQEVLALEQGSVFVTIARTPPTHEVEVLREIQADPTNEQSETDHERQIWILAGDAGCGKTTMLRHWALCLFGGISDLRATSPLPVFLSLRHLSRCIRLSDSPRLTRSVFAEALRETVPGVDPTFAIRALWQDATVSTSESPPEKPRLIFLLDGLDEMDESGRLVLIGWLRNLPRDARAVVTCRPGIVSELGGLHRSVSYKICDFDEEQIHSFISQWFTSIPYLGHKFSECLTSNRALADLAVIPLMLTCLCMDVEISRRCEYSYDFVKRTLYRRVMGMLLEEWDALKSHRTPNPLVIELGLRVFEELAVNFPFDDTFPYSTFVSISQNLSRKLGIANKAASAWVNSIVVSGRLLIHDLEYGYSFRHKAFHDFFFAEGIRTRLENEMGQANDVENT